MIASSQFQEKGDANHTFIQIFPFEKFGHEFLKSSVTKKSSMTDIFNSQEYF